MTQVLLLLLLLIMKRGFIFLTDIDTAADRWLLLSCGWQFFFCSSFPFRWIVKKKRALTPAVDERRCGRECDGIGWATEHLLLGVRASHVGTRKSLNLTLYILIPFILEGEKKLWAAACRVLSFFYVLVFVGLINYSSN